MLHDLRKIFKHATIYGSGVILSKMVGFLLIPIYTRCLTPKDYGILELLNTSVYFIGIVVGMGITSAIFRYYYAYHDNKQRNALISTAFLLVLTLNAVITGALIIFSRPFSLLLLGDKNLFYFVDLIMISTFFDTQNGIIISYIQVNKRSILYNILSVLRLTIGLIFNIAFIVYLKMGVAGVLWSSLISAVLIFMVLFVFLIKKVGVSFSRGIAIEITKYSIPLVPSTIFMLMLHFLDRYILRMYVPLADIGIYSLGYNFGFMIQFLITGPFNQIWGPYRFELDKEKKSDQLFPKILTYYCMIAIGFFLVLSVLIKDILHLLVGSAFWEAYKVVPLVSAGYIFLGMTYIIESGIYIKKKTYLRTVSVGTAVVVCAACNLILIPTIGIMGAAVATFLSFLTLAVISLMLVRNLYPLTYEWMRIGKIFASAALAFYISQLVNSNTLAHSLLLKSLSISIFPFMLFVFNFFEKRELEHMLRLFHYALINAKGLACQRRI